MGFSAKELEVIEATVAGLCRRRSPEELADQLRTVYEVKGDAIVIREERPPWDGIGDWPRAPVARLKLDRATGQWSLYRTSTSTGVLGGK